MIDAKTIQLLLDDLLPLVRRFPDLLVRNVAYNRNFVELLFNLYQKDLPFADQLKDLWPEQTLRAGIRYQERGDAHYDNARVKQLQSLLQDDYRVLHQALRGRFQGVNNDLNRLKRCTDFAGLAKKLLRISPLVYDARGKASPLNRFEMTGFPGPDELQQYYYDTFKVHLAGVFLQLSAKPGFGELRHFVGNMLNQFIPKQVIPATSRYTAASEQVRERELFLEEVPPLYTLFRGALALDCSMVTVPYFGVLQNTRVFWLERSSGKNAGHFAYLFLAEVTLGDELVPYVITINGANINAMDCRAICHLLREIYQTSCVLIADVRKVDYLVNSSSIEQAMRVLGGEGVHVDLPSGWHSCLIGL
jgi:hypothetical protein